MDCAFCNKPLKGITAYLLVLGYNSIPLCFSCGNHYRQHGALLTGL